MADYDYQLIGKTVVLLLETLKLLPSPSKASPKTPKEKIVSSEEEEEEEEEELPSEADAVAYLISFLKKHNGPVLLSRLGYDISKEIKSAITKNGKKSIRAFLRGFPETFAVPEARSGYESVELTKKAGGQADEIQREEVVKEKTVKERAPHSLKVTCKFFSTKNGCQWGDKCHRQHIVPDKKED